MTKEDAIKYLQQLYPNGGHCWLDEQRIEAIDMAVKALQEETDNIWHDSNEEQPEEYRTVVVWNPSTMDGEVLTRCAEVYKGRIWAYIEDLLNLSNIRKTVKNCKEPLSEDLGKEMDNYLPTVFSKDMDGGEPRFTTWFNALRKTAIYFAKWQKEQMMAKAIDGDITFDYYGDDDKTYGCIAHDSFCLEDFGLKDRDKVKVIVINKD